MIMMQKIHRTNLRFVGERMKIINGLKVKEKKYSGVLMILILSFLLHLIPILLLRLQHQDQMR